MPEESAKLRIPYIAAAQAQKHVTHNEAMTLLDTLVQLSVLDKDLTAPPGSPDEGDCYIVAGAGGTATGAWAGWEKRVARFIDGEWRSYLPGEGGGAGWLAWVLDEDAMYRFDGADWELAGIEGPAGEPGPSIAPDAVVNEIADRDDYDDEPAGFSVLVASDSGNGGWATLYYKLSASSADWSDPVTFPGQQFLDRLAARIGTIFLHAAASPPTGALKANGVAVLIASYPEFAAAIYCGNANNATASWGYKATTNVSPGSNRSTSGTYIVLPDARGEFFRGWDDGRGVDSGRTLWSYQADGAPNITGSVATNSGRGYITSATGAFASASPGSNSGTTASGSFGTQFDFNASASSSKYGAASEIRARNFAALACIWYQ
jgi:hypothetical protein